MDGGHLRAAERVDLEPAREATWGEPADREFVDALATDIAARANCTVCVIEVVRADSMVECIAVHGSPVGEVRQVGHVRELSTIGTGSAGLVAHGALIFFPARRRSMGTTSLNARDGSHVPDPRVADESADWVPGDRVMVRLRDRQRAVRALVQLGSPLHGKRPRIEDLKTLEEELDLSFRALLVSIEHERVTQQVRMERAVRRVLRATGDHTAPGGVVHLVRQQMREGFRALELYIHLYDDDDLPTPENSQVSRGLFDGLLEAAHRAWTRDDIVILEDGLVWGDEVLQRDHGEEIAQRFSREQVGSVVLVPIGDGSTLLGTMTIVRAPDGPRWTESEGAAAIDAGRDLGHAICNARAFEREQQLNHELRRLDNYRTQLIATLSHELRNPTGVILGHLEMLKESDGLDREVQHSLNAVERAALRIDTLSQDLLVLRALEDPDHPLKRQEVDLVGLVREVVELAQMDAARAKVTVGVECTDEPVLVCGDGAELTKVLTNLVSNAVKYSDAGGVVRVAVERDGDTAVLTCTDDGIGISEVDQEKLFREFFRSTNFDALRRPGNGLGLSIVHRIVTRHGGTIQIESTLGEGTTFRLTLPAVEGTAQGTADGTAD
ncbi:sensor histidine kinase [Nocardioides gilvus]|uniref:sensor histidine kinase n=1 Tax=Nocardioides gilvus TaxID=1735589 RepID=UPI000D74979C|nr:HAMP domain-containing sensor histidine kinase [Nocardioides gilvus]